MDSKMLEDYSYSVKWSEEDQTFISRVSEFPLLAAHGDTEEQAFHEIKEVVSVIAKDLEKQGKDLPKPGQIAKGSSKTKKELPIIPLDEKVCSKCSYWQYAEDNGSLGHCTHESQDGELVDLEDMRADQSPCDMWSPRCRECGDPAHIQFFFYRKYVKPSSAWYCNDCAEGLGLTQKS